MTPRTRVYITIDTECAEERGASAPPLGWDLRVWGRFANQRRPLGIELIMDELERAGLRGTFFTEALGSAYFGEPGLAEVCAALIGRGHDVQLHTHPRQRVANWRTRGEPPAPDDASAYDVATQAAMLREGVAILERCGAPAGSVLAYRAGNFGASNASWEAIAAAGLVVSANYNPGYFHRNCQMRHADASAGLFRAAHGVWELPISTLVEPGDHHRHLQITAVSIPELTGYLDDAHRAGLGEVTIVTHSFELYHTDSVSPRRGRPSTVNVLRLRALCRFLAEHDDRFEVDTVGALARRLRDGVEPPPRRFAPLAARRGRRWVRYAAQLYKRIEAKVGWSPPVA